MKKIILLLSVCFFFVEASVSQLATQWRGQDRKGIYYEENLLKTWPTSGPKLMWYNDEVGDGYGSPAVTSDKIFIAGAVDSIGWLFAFDLKGKFLWKADYGKEWVRTFPGSRSTPTVVDNLVYICSGIGNLICFNAENGEKKWEADMKKAMNKLPYHGHSESPLIYTDMVYLVNGEPDLNIIAFDRFTGKTKWQSKGLGEISGYNSPVLVEHNGKPMLVTFTAYSLMGIDAETGELLWTHEQVNTPLDKRTPGNGDTHSNSIWYENGSIYYIAGDGNCAVKLELSKDGKQVNQAWRNTNIDNFMGGFIKLDNHIYSCTNSAKDLKCIDAGSGNVTDSLNIGIGTIIMADKHLYYYNQKGEVHLINIDSGKMKSVSSFKIDKGTKEHFSHPVISNGVLYIRHGKSLMAYKIKN